MTNRILDLRPFKYRDLKRDKVLDENNKPIVKKIKDQKTGEEVEQYLYDMFEVEMEFPTDHIKVFYASFLGNSGINPNPKYHLYGRDKYRRNKLADRIEDCDSESIELTGNDYKMLELAVDEIGGKFPRKHNEILRRVFEAPEVEKKQS